MSLADRIDALWHVLRADSRRGERARRRAAATAAMGTFLLVLLALVGLLQMILVALAVVACGALLVAAALLARRYRGRLVDRAALERAARSLGAWSTAGRRELAVGIARAGRRTRVAAEKVRQRGEGWPTRAAVDRRREALRLNGAGTQLRRDGAYLEAAEQHRLALALFQGLGDRRSEALTLNTLALALDRAGDPAALDLFEEAATILGELGEQEQEGQVIANLALAFRRRGREDRSDEALEAALGKLDPASQAYRRVEELRRAS